MKYLFPLLTILLIACNTNNQATTEGTTNKVLTPTEFKTQLKTAGANAQLIDVRTPGEIAEGAIQGHKNLDYQANNFKQQIQALDKEKPVFVYCASGGRSGKTSNILAGMGFKEVYDLKGGYTSWAAENK